MAIPLNKAAVRCEKMAIANGRITPNSSSRPLLYDISRHWRRLLDATGYRSESLSLWSEREVEASEVIISSLAYLQRIGCSNIEQLLKDTMERHARLNG